MIRTRIAYEAPQLGMLMPLEIPARRQGDTHEARWNLRVRRWHKGKVR